VPSDDDLRAQLRALSIVSGFESTFLYPVPVEMVHACSYFCDALSPLWSIQPIDDIVLKTEGVPLSPALQVAIDWLVGHGLLVPSGVAYAKTARQTRLRADLTLNRALANRVLEAVEADEKLSRETSFVREVAAALAAMGPGAETRAVFHDANYQDPLAGMQSVLDLVPEEGRSSATQSVLRSFSALARTAMGSELSESELTALYTRHLQSLVAAQESP
jgi:hypothetical protein